VWIPVVCVENSEIGLTRVLYEQDKRRENRDIDIAHDIVFGTLSTV
jgi:hypothetical protein